MHEDQPAQKATGRGAGGGEEGLRTTRHPQAKNLAASHTESRAIMLESSLSPPPEDKIMHNAHWRSVVCMNK